MAVLVPLGWILVESGDVRRWRGASVLRHFFRDSVSLFVRENTPELRWFPWSFRSVSQAFWKEERNRMWFVSYLASCFAIRVPQDWYCVDLVGFEGHGGAGLMAGYYGSIVRFLRANFPYFEWEEWRFVHRSKKTWREKENHGKVFLGFGREKGIEREEDWLIFEHQMALRESFGGLLKRYYGNSPMQFISSFLSSSFLEKYRESVEAWERYWKQWGSVKAEKDVGSVICSQLYPHTLAFFQHKLTHMRYVTELDVYLPSLALGIEYQGEQHFQEIGRVLQETKQIKERDRKKEKICNHLGITLLPIPYFHFEEEKGREEKKKMVSSHIHNSRPDLMKIKLEKIK